MAAPVWANKGTFASGTGALTVTVPTGYVAGDTFLLFVESANNNIATPSGWLEVEDSPQFTGTAATIGGVRLAVFWRTATASESSASVADSGNHTTAQIHLFTGCDASNPIHVAAGSVQAVAATDWTMPAVFTAHSECLIVLAIANDRDLANTAGITSFTNSNLSNLTEQHDQTIASGVGGGLAIATGDMVNPGDTGTTAVVSAASNTAAFLTIALRPKRALDVVGVQKGFALTLSGFAGGMTYGNGTLVTIPYNTNLGSVSPDGITWTPAVNTLSSAMKVVIYGQGKFVGLASTSLSIKSTDGINWTSDSLPATGINWNGLAYGNGVFVATGYNTTVAASSPDGATWTLRATPSIANWYGLAYGNGVFVTVAASSNKAATTPDGITWTPQVMPVVTTWRPIAFGNGVFVVLANNTTIAATSPDGAVWTQRTLPVSANWLSLTFGAGLFFAVGYGGTIAISSPDGITWTQHVLPASANWNQSAYGAGKFIVGSSSSKTISVMPFGSPMAIASAQAALTTTPLGVNLVGTASGSTYIVLGNWAAVNDMVVIMAFRDGSVTPPSLPTGCTSLDATGSGASSSRLAYRALTAAEAQAIGPFLNATSVVANVYRGGSAANPIGGWALSTGTGSTVTLPALASDGSSTVTGFVGHRSTDVSFPASQNTLVLRSQEVDATDAIAVYDTAGPAT